MPSELQAERHGSTLLLSLSGRDSRNALSAQACAAGIEALNIAEEDPHVRCVVWRGDGTPFCSGLPQPPKHAADAAAAATLIERMHALVHALRTFPKPVLAAVEGEARGAGCALALACDLIVAADDASFELPDIERGLPPSGAVVGELWQRLPRRDALRMLWLGEPMTAARWHELGLIDSLAPTGQALRAALQWAARLERLPPDALAAIKECALRASASGLAVQLEFERELVLRCLRRALRTD